MTLEVRLRRHTFFWATSMLIWYGSSVTLAQDVPAASDNQRVNHIVGPHPTDPIDDDDPNDQAHTKAQNETTIAIMRDQAGSALKLFAAWNDHSWRDADPNKVLSIDRTIGFGVSETLEGGWNVHDLARSRDGYAADGYLPPPPGRAERRWTTIQQDPVAAVIPPYSGITGVHLVGMDGGWAGARIFYATSPDGQNYDPNEVQTIHDAGPGGAADKPFVSVWGSLADGTPKYICATWTDVGKIIYSLSIDGGPFSAPTRVSTLPPAASQWSASAFAPPPAGATHPYLYIVWWELDRIVWRRSRDLGATWFPPAGPGVVAEINKLRDGVTQGRLVNFQLTDQPSIAVDHTCARKGWVYVCYASEVPPGAADPDAPCDPNTCQPDIFVSRYEYDSADPNNVVWQAPVRVNNDNPTLRTVQVMPWIAINDVGHLGVGFYDRRDDPDNRLQHYYFAYSTDGANRFQENVPVSDPNSPSNTYGGGGGFIGDYTTIAGASNNFYAVWCDTRNWDPTTAPDRKGDIYFAEVEMAVPPDFDWDCDVDLDDFGTFATCYNGSGRPPAENCPSGANADFDNDCDVDLDDFGVLGACYNGSENPPAPSCPWEACRGGGEAAMGSGGPELDAGDEPTADELYWLLYEYCQENGIPFT